MRGHVQKRGAARHRSLGEVRRSKRATLRQFKTIQGSRLKAVVVVDSIPWGGQVQEEMRASRRGRDDFNSCRCYDGSDSLLVVYTSA